METSSRGSPEGVEREDASSYEPFELQPSLLDTVSDVCPAGEAEEIWRVVGPSLAEQARDLLDEVHKSPATLVVLSFRFVMVGTN